MSTIYNIKEAAKLLNRSVKTLQRWDRDGILLAFRTKTNRRFYYKKQIDSHLGILPSSDSRFKIAYCRVSSQNQKKDLLNQRKIVEEFCVSKGLDGVTYINEVGGGLNFRRKHFLSLISRIIKNEISHLIIAHKDRLTRFGYELIQNICLEHECNLILINNESLSPEQEMVQDLMTIIHCFSSRLYGLRNYKKTLLKALKSEPVS